MMVIESEFDFGEIVYLTTDVDQKARMVTMVIVQPTGVLYKLSCGTGDSSHFGIEISREKTVY